VVLLIISGIFYAVNNLLWKKLVDLLSPMAIMLIRACMTSAMAFILLNSLFSEHSADLSMHWKALLWPSISGALGLSFMITGLKKGNLTQLGIYNLLGVLFTATYLLIYEEVAIGRYLYGGILLISGYLIFLSIENKGAKSPSHWTSHLLFAGMVLFFAISTILHWHNLQAEVSPLASLFFQELCVLATAVILLGLVEKKLSWVQVWKTSGQLPWIVLQAGLIFGAVFLGFLGLKALDPLASALIGLGTPLITIGLDALFYRRPIHKLMLITIVLCSLGFVLLSMV
jgi:drug/metabolite transporter (DMT)-like permease